MRSRRPNLVDQLAAELRSGLEEGRWKGWMPRERDLAESLEVSRDTLRRALARLKAEGLIEAEQGKGNRIAERRAAESMSWRQRSAVGLISPEVLEESAPLVQLWISELRRMLANQSLELRFFSSRRLFVKSSAKELARLTEAEGCFVWILVKATESMQRWFAKSGLNVLMAGRPQEALNLPYVDVDYKAVAHHAANRLARLGHRRIAFLVNAGRMPGDWASVKGFMEAGEGWQGHLELEVVEYGPGASELLRELKRTMGMENRPTALLVDQPATYLTVSSYLQNHGWKVPDDVSLVCRIGDRVLGFLYPICERYEWSALTYARRVMEPLRTLARGGQIGGWHTRIMPEHKPGKSVGPPKP